MNRYLIRFYLVNGKQIRDIREDIDIDELHLRLVNSMREEQAYRVYAERSDTSDLTFRWEHVLYFEIEFSGLEGTQPIHLNIEEN